MVGKTLFHEPPAIASSLDSNHSEIVADRACPIAGKTIQKFANLSLM